MPLGRSGMRAAKMGVFQHNSASYNCCWTAHLLIDLQQPGSSCRCNISSKQPTACPRFSLQKKQLEQAMAIQV
eukprot:264904-Pelagomonas_calceolata.AAC.3